MNLYVYYISRMFALAGIMIFLILIQSVGIGLGERRQRAAYERLAASVSDPGSAHLEWIFWPPLTIVAGTYKGQTFRYCRASGKHSHLYLACHPVRTFEISRRHSVKGRRAFFSSGQALNAFAGQVPWSKRTMDRRPLGFGSAPGVDLYQENANFFDAAALAQ